MVTHPGIQTKPKMPAPKMGKDGHPVFDENRVYEGPDHITSILWIMAGCNVKDALADFQMELEDETFNSGGNLPRRRTAAIRSSYMA
jgi:hypothetical protein